MLDFSTIPFFDNHTHRIDVSNRAIEPLDLPIAFVHGWGDVIRPDEAVNSAGPDNCSPEFAYHVENMGVTKALVCLLAKKYGCAATLEAVTEERNKRTLADGFGYAKELYKEAGVIGEMADDDAPYGDPVLDCFPTKLYRLFRMDPCIKALLPESESFADLKAKFDAAVREALEEG